MAGKSRIGEVYLQVAPVLDGMSDAIAEQVSGGFKEANKTTEGQATETGKKSGVALAAAAASAIGAGKIAQALGSQFKQGYENAIEQMDANADITANLNLDAGQSEMVSESIKELYTSGLGETYTEVAETMETIVSSIKGAREMSSDELSKMGRDFENLSKQYGYESADIAKAVNSMVASGFSTDADAALQSLHNGFQTLGVGAEDMLETLDEFSADFKTFGLEGDKAMQFMQKGLEGGIRNTDAMGNSLNELSMILRDRSKDEDFINAGIDPDKIRAQMAEGGQAGVDAIEEIFSKLDVDEAGALLSQTMSSYGEDFLDEWKAVDFGQINGDLGDTVQTLEEFNEEVNSGVSHELTEIKRNFEQAFADAIIPVLEAVLPLLTSFTEFLKENTWVMRIAVPVIGVLLVAALALMAAALWSVAAAGWAAIAPLLPIVGTVLLVVAAVAAVIAIIWLLVENWDAVWGFIKNVAAGVGDWFVGLWNGIADFFVNLWNGIGQWFSDLWNGITDFFVGIWDGVIGWFQDVFYGVRNFFVNLWDGIVDYFVGVYNTLKSIINDIIDMIPGGRFVVDVGGGIINGVKSFFGGGKGISMMADGGTIPATPGGKLAILGEAGRDEVVMDKGKWNRLLDQINRDGNEKNNGTIIDVVGITVYQQPGESTEELLERINDSLDFNGLRG